MIIIGVVMVLKLAQTPAFSLLPLLVSKHFGGDAAQLSLLEAVMGVGTIVGGLVLSVWGGFRRKIYTTMLGLVVSGSSLVVLGLTPGGSFGIALAAISVVGLVMPLIDGPILAIVQAKVAPEMQGRVFTLLISLLGVTSPISLAIAGPVSDWLGLQIWYIVAGALCMATGLILSFVPAVVNIEEREEPVKNGHDT
jgi:DHA3 family macrolide efflux protein-like MFS transporter